MDKAELILSSRCYGHSFKPALVLLHGFLGSKQDWDALMPSLSQHFHCVCLDLPGHGESPSVALEQPGFVQVARLIRRTLSTLKIDHFHLLGYSLGGRIALHLAQLMPENMMSVTLESCHHGLSNEVQRAERINNDKLWDNRLQNLSIDAFLTLWYRQGVFTDLTADARVQLIERRRHNDTTALRSVYLATSLGFQQDLSLIPNQSITPWHYFVGKNDNKFSSLAENWRSKAAITLHYFENAGHNVHLADGEAFCHTLIQHLLKDLK